MEGRLKPILCYVSPAGNNKIADWYEGLSDQERSDADEFIKDMRKTQEWKMPEYRPKLSGRGHLGELRWKSENKQHRLVGYLRAGAFYALIGCTHKQSIYDPADALDTAERRKRDIENARATVTAYEL